MTTMFSSEVRSVLAQVIGSWQVIVVTVVIVIFIMILNNVTRYRVRRPSKPKVVKAKGEASKEAPAKASKPDTSEIIDDDE